MSFYLYLRKLHREESAKSTGGASRTPTFPCARENVDKRAPTPATRKRIMPYMSMMSATWIKSTGNEQMVFVPDPPQFTIFKVEIPDQLLDEKDIAYLADYED